MLASRRLSETGQRRGPEPVGTAAVGGPAGAAVAGPTAVGGPAGAAAAEQDRELARLLERIPSLAGRPRRVEALPGGLTNRNYKVTTPDRAVVVRCWAPGSELLSIDREREYRNSLAAAAAGVGAPVVDYLPAEGVLVVGFIPGRTLRNEDFQRPGTLARVAGSCRRLHHGPRFVNDFNMFELLHSYLGVVAERGFTVPPGYLEMLPRLEEVRQALAVRDPGTRPCNNDLLAGNFVDDGARIHLIDYEYSGNNDPSFELGNIFSECALGTEQLEELVGAYHGRVTRSLLARARLQAVVARYGWTLWGAIQHAASPLDYDFWSWALQRYEAALADLRGPDLPRLLADVQRHD